MMVLIVMGVNTLLYVKYVGCTEDVMNEVKIAGFGKECWIGGNRKRYEGGYCGVVSKFWLVD